MIGLFLITHGAIGEALVQCASHVLGAQPAQLMQLGVAPQDEPQALRDAAREILASLTDHGEVLILTDLFGSTPANIASELLKPGRVMGVAGVNLPMLLKVLTHRHESLLELVARAVAGGREGVLHIE